MELVSETMPAEPVSLRGLVASVVGMAREGTALARFLAEQGAVVTISDRKTEGELTVVLQSLAGVPMRRFLGGHPLELLDCQVLFVSPGVPLDSPIIVEARRRRLPMSSESRLFASLCPAKIIGVTGSSGKTTTVTLIGEMIEAAGGHVHVGGNIGNPLLGQLDSITTDEIVVLELSSFQLAYWGSVLDAEPHPELVSPLFPPVGRRPAVAVLLNITPNHLDRHPSMADYTAAKAKILQHQQPADHAVLNWDDPVVRGLQRYTQSRAGYFSLTEPVVEGAFLKGDALLLRTQGREQHICTAQQVQLRGRHNIANLLAASVACAALGVPVDAMTAVASSFGGVEHRLERVRAVHGVWYYNDSIATSPERAIAALRSFAEPIVLLAGGRDKHLPWDEWSAVVGEKAIHVVLFGEAASMIDGVLARLGSRSPGVSRVETLADAVRTAHQYAKPGQVVLFSPGGTSFDAFGDYVERGLAFKRLVGELF
jgi:UDP-N-acetylmuramoylalanine--D-glutamate ligase